MKLPYRSWPNANSKRCRRCDRNLRVLEVLGPRKHFGVALVTVKVLPPWSPVKLAPLLFQDERGQIGHEETAVA